jgi:FdhE protein
VTSRTGADAASELERSSERARLLAEEASPARDALRFAAGLYRAQARIASALAANGTLSGALETDAPRLVGLAPHVLRYAAEAAPQPLSEEARARLEDDSATARARLEVSWEGGPPAADDYLTRALLRPYVAALRAANVKPARPMRRGHCPFCGGAPRVSARRGGAEMEGARRSLVCALCGGEWLFERILCASCFEEDPRKLPAFQSGRHPTVRIEACETCRRYVKSLDLSQDARPIPEVDDLVSIAMDLWAAEQGFVRIEPGLAGI